MAGKFIEFDEVAKLLRLSPEELSEMRGRGDIYGYRDGASWKFKVEEVHRVAEERGVDLSEGPQMGADEELAPLSFDKEGSAIDGGSDLTLDDDSSILVSEEELGRSSEGTSSTVIGKGDSAESGAGSDLDFDGGSDLALDDDDDVTIGSDVLQPGEFLEEGDDDTGKLLGEGSDALEQEVPLKSPGESDLVLDEGELTLDDSDLASQSDAGSSVDLVGDDDLVLGGSGIGSDLTLGAADSGINLSTPTDSGLSLEDEPLDLTGSDAESLALPEDEEEEIVALEAEETADADAATQLKSDDEFLLTPIEEETEDESSGSQVIALEDSEAFDGAAETLLGEAALDPMLVAEDGGAPAMEDFGGGEVAQATAVPGLSPAARMTQIAEAPYSVWNIVGLTLVLLVLTISGMFMVDVVRNMWEFDGSSTATSSLMDGILGALKFDQ